MTGKELVLLLVGSAAAAGAGGVGAARLINDGPANDAGQSALLARLDELGASLEATNGILTESRDEIGALRGRMEAVELRLNGARAAALTTASGRRHVAAPARRGATTLRSGEDGVLDLTTAGEGGVPVQLEKALAGLAESLGEHAGGGMIGTMIEGGGSLRVLNGELGGTLAGLRRSFALRRLPEEERWEKAREDVGLNDVQIDEIRSALVERDAAIERAMVVARDESDGNAGISVRRLDFAKTREADQAYRKRVDNTLNDQQKKAWNDGGYDRAFGNSATGTATVISIGTITSDEEQ